MFDRLNAQQQPFIQGGYGAMSKLNTLLGLGDSRAIPLGGNASLMPRSSYAPTHEGSIDKRIPTPVTQGPSAQGVPQNVPQNMRLKQILALRAQNGDTEAARVLGAI